MKRERSCGRPVTPALRKTAVACALIEALEDHDDVQKVFSDFELSDEALKQLEASA